MAQYYLSKNGQQSGPFSQQQIDQMLQSGLFSGTESLRQEDSPDWKPISQLPGFVAPPAPRKSNSCLIVGLICGGGALLLVPVIALLAAIAVPNFLRARKRSQATQELESLRLIDSAIDQYSIEHNKEPGSPVDWADIQTYLRPGSRLGNSGGVDILGNSYGPEFKVDSLPKVPEATYEALSDVAPAEFWSPYK